MVAGSDVKPWLRGQCLDSALSTPARLLHRAYRMQGGRGSYEEFAGVIVGRCPGLRTSTVKDTLVVHGIAPRWDREKLEELAA